MPIRIEFESISILSMFPYLIALCPTVDNKGFDTI